MWRGSGSLSSEGATHGKVHESTAWRAYPTATLLGRPKITLYKWIRQANIPRRFVFMDGARQMLIRQADVFRLDQARGGRSNRPARNPNHARFNDPTQPATCAAVWWTWSFRVVEGPPAQASLAYRREFQEIIRQWKRGA